MLTTLGAILILIGLFFPLFEVSYSPPGGSALVYGNRIFAFSDVINGWQLAAAAPWTRLLEIVGILALPVIMLITKGAIDLLARPLHVIATLSVTFGWLVLLGVQVLQHNLVLPPTGQSGLIAAFEGNPLLGFPGVPGPGTPYFTATFGVGWWLELVGLLSALLGMWRLAIPVGVVCIALLAVTNLVAHPTFTWLVTWIF